MSRARQILEVLYGKKFVLKVGTGLSAHRFAVLLSKNVIPGELPYRVTWFYLDGRSGKMHHDPYGHMDIDDEEAQLVMSGTPSEDFKARLKMETYMGPFCGADTATRRHTKIDLDRDNPEWNDYPDSRVDRWETT
jgi:hypothetical protein